VLAVEKLVQSKLLIPGANRRIQTIDRHMGFVRVNAIPKLIVSHRIFRQRPVWSQMAGSLPTNQGMRPGLFDLSSTTHRLPRWVSIAVPCARVFTLG
jgi:hypothetical protein